MRTTISIEDQLLQAAKQRALDREITLGGVIEDALRVALDPDERRPKSAVALPVSTRTGGVRPGVEVAAGARLRDLMDEA
ncbi:MAG: antitoxin [Solirubrobacteraceae bacterium]